MHCSFESLIQTQSFPICNFINFVNPTEFFAEDADLNETDYHDLHCFVFFLFSGHPDNNRHILKWRRNINGVKRVEEKFVELQIMSKQFCQCLIVIYLFIHLFISGSKNMLCYK